MKVIVEMPLINNLSVNHYLIKTRRGVFKRKEIKAWQEALGWQIKTAHIEDWGLPLRVTCDLVQTDYRTRDISNYSKVVLDAIEEASGVNDMYMRWQDGQIFHTGANPVLIIEISDEIMKGE